MTPARAIACLRHYMVESGKPAFILLLTKPHEMWQTPHEMWCLSASAKEVMDAAKFGVLAIELCEKRRKDWDYAREISAYEAACEAKP